jgi:hypothetical protein
LAARTPRGISRRPDIAPPVLCTSMVTMLEAAASANRGIFSRMSIRGFERAA